MGAHAAQAALATGLPLACITAGPRPAWLPPEIEALPNPAASQGLGTSVALAARTAAERGYPALLIHLADMPCVPAALLRELAQSREATACRHAGGEPGVPALLPARLFGALQALRGEQGAGRLLRALPDLAVIDPPAEWLIDVDIPEALTAAAALLGDAAAD